MQHKFKAALLVLFIVLAGFIRETLFVRVTWHYIVAIGEADPPPRNWLFSFLEDCSADQLTKLKYIFTLLFIAIFFGIALLLVRWFFNTQSNFKLVYWSFGLLFGLGLFLFACGYIFPGKQQWYTLSRWIIGVIETPLCIILLYPVLWLKARTD